MAYYETYTLSLACCQWGTTQAATDTTLTEERLRSMLQNNRYLFDCKPRLHVGLRGVGIPEHRTTTTCFKGTSVPEWYGPTLRTATRFDRQYNAGPHYGEWLILP